MDAIDPNETLRQAAGLGELTFVISLCILIGASFVGLILWKIVIPGYQVKAEREAKLVDSQVKTLDTASETGVALTKAYNRLVELLDSDRSDHRDFRRETNENFGIVHKRIDRLFERPGRSSDGSLDIPKE